MNPTVLNQRVIWDARSLKQVDEAKSRYRQAKAAGYDCVGTDGNPLLRFHPSLEEFIVKARTQPHAHVMKVLCDKGDERIIWDMDNGQQGKEAKAKFESLIKKGYKAYSVDVKGQKNRRIEEFDVEAEEILMVPPTAKG